MSHRIPLHDDWKLEAVDDLETLQNNNPPLAQAALAAVDDLVNHRKVGSELDKRRTSGDLSGLLRLKFDLPDTHPERYRIVYEMADENSIIIWGIGPRASQWIYRLVDSRR